MSSGFEMTFVKVGNVNEVVNFFLVSCNFIFQFGDLNGVVGG